MTLWQGAYLRLRIADSTLEVCHLVRSGLLFLAVGQSVTGDLSVLAYHPTQGGNDTLCDSVFKVCFPAGSLCLYIYHTDITLRGD
jgi:hypothetical protein